MKRSVYRNLKVKASKGVNKYFINHPFERPEHFHWREVLYFQMRFKKQFAQSR